MDPDSPNCPVFASLIPFPLEMHNWVLMHMPTASSIAPTRGKYVLYVGTHHGRLQEKEKYLSDYSAVLYECVIVLLALTASPMLSPSAGGGSGSCHPRLLWWKLQYTVLTDRA
jgi:hypothetical protein